MILQPGDCQGDQEHFTIKNQYPITEALYLAGENSTIHVKKIDHGCITSSMVGMPLPKFGLS
jgi:hypothetical protein